jgi:streptogramin lyase
VTDFLTELRGELLDGLERYERAPRRRSVARRRIGPATRRIAAVAVAAAATITAVVQIANRSDDLEHTTAPLVSQLEGFHASGLAAVDDSLWISQYDFSSLQRIDLRTGKVRATIDVGGSPGAVIVAGGAVWVHDWERGRLVKVDPRRNRVVKTLTPGSAIGDIAFAAGSVWAVTENEMLLRVDPETATVTKRVPLDGTRVHTGHSTAPSVVAGGDTLWVTAGTRVMEFDATTGQPLGRTRGPALATEIARRIVADDSGLWISSPFRREVIHIDARTRQATRFSVGGDPGSIAIVDGRVWVGTLHDGGALTRVTALDTDGRVAGTMPVPHPAVHIGSSPGGGAWVTFGENNTFSPAAVHLSGP